MSQNSAFYSVMTMLFYIVNHFVILLESFVLVKWDNGPKLFYGTNASQINWNMPLDCHCSVLSSFQGVPMCISHYCGENLDILHQSGKMYWKNINSTVMMKPRPEYMPVMLDALFLFSSLSVTCGWAHGWDVVKGCECCAYIVTVERPSCTGLSY